MNFHTPIRTPKNLKNTISPTPNSNALLDEKMREINTLRTQLDSEKYDRGFLEVQVKQYEDQVNRLSKSFCHLNPILFLLILIFYFFSSRRT